MKMVSMERTAKSESPICAPMEENKYPYGLRICLDNDSIKKLGLKELPEVGKTMKITAVVEVCGVNMNETKTSEYKSIDLQITEMGIEGKKSNPAEKLYAKKD